MTRTGIRRSIATLTTTALLFAAPPLAAAAPERPSGTAAAPDEKVEKEVERTLVERRRNMMQEAHSALDETNAALRALDGGNAKEALEALARATGKLELVVARDPGLALAPVDVELVTHDVYATPEAIREAREEALKKLEDGKVQEARALLSALASEIVVRVTNLPLATYPEAIKRVSPLIDEGKIEPAKAALRAALNTLVVTDHVISLPVLRARQLLDEAEELVKRDERSDEDSRRIAELVDGARKQLEMAELLGYGDEQEYEEFRQQIAELKSKIGADKETESIFATLRRSLDGFQSSFFE